jgi:Rps23 Pro-64 3,4-dihydroxylase Tpa1-like proline 4-hydroxylase
MSRDYPFYHHVADNFFDEKKAITLSEEFPDYKSDAWFCYNNPLENKKSCNNWYYFGSETYKTFLYLNSPDFIKKLERFTGIKKLYPDIGLHGGGLHIHGTGGKLNIHLDYSIHPKLKLQRKLNLIVYLEKDWNPEWGGNLEFWSHNKEKNKPDKRFVTVQNVFNRAVLFDTTQNSWHGFPEPLTCPEGKYRKSIAVYYLTDPPEGTNPRPRALYAPTKEQETDLEILKLIQDRSNL